MFIPRFWFLSRYRKLYFGVESVIWWRLMFAQAFYYVLYVICCTLEEILRHFKFWGRNGYTHWIGCAITWCRLGNNRWFCYFVRFFEYFFSNGILLFLAISIAITPIMSVCIPAVVAPRAMCRAWGMGAWSAPVGRSTIMRELRNNKKMRPLDAYQLQLDYLSLISISS